MSAVAYRLPNTVRPPHLELLPALPAASSPSALVYRRRRILALCLAVVTFLALSSVVALAMPSGASDVSVVPGSVKAVSGTEWVVRPGDTLWSIVVRAHPDSDPRPLVSQISKSRNGSALKVGERIVVPS